MPLRHVFPRAWRRGVSRALGRYDERQAVAEIHKLARTTAPIVVGPWTGEVGFEVLYWIPFLRWAVETGALSPDRVIACSRGGVETWYAGIASRYVDVFDFVSPAQLRQETAWRKAVHGEQKQSTRAEFDGRLIASVREATGRDLQVLHPATMFRLFRRFFWRHAGVEWVLRRARYQRWPTPPPMPGLPDAYVAAKFYVNDAMRDAAPTREAVAQLVGAVSQRIPVVSLDTGLQMDDHAALMPAGTVVAAGLDQARVNLQRQAAILAGARAFIGTYGGFAYVPAFYGVAATTFFTPPEGFARTHLQMAETVFASLDVPPLRVLPLGDASAAVGDVCRALGATA
jgi:hypothetical protein